ncbi:MAG TPA: hypothetical protein VK195_04580, partial [Burkholderiaceae bacterium]|nr:hypothetical protein [Burkholderiaceae bacterium]
MPSQLSLLAQDLTALRGLMHELSDPVLLLGQRLDILEANPAAQALDLQAGGHLQGLRTAAGTKVWDWLKLATQALAEGRRAPTAPTWALSDGRRAQLKLIGLNPEPQDPSCWMLHARIESAHESPRPARPARTVLGRHQAGEAPVPPRPLPAGTPAAVPPGAGEDPLQWVWQAALPAFVEDGQHRLLAAN